MNAMAQQLRQQRSPANIMSAVPSIAAAIVDGGRG
jgi:hypothetical protein